MRIMLAGIALLVTFNGNVAAAARHLSKSPQRGKIKLTGLGFPNQMLETAVL